MEPPITYDNIVSKLVEAVPESRVLVQYEIDTFGEVMNYGVFGQLPRFMSDIYRLSQEDTREAIQHAETFARLLTFIETAAKSGNHDIETLIMFGIMESMWQTGDAQPLIVERFGPRTKELYTATLAHWEWLRRVAKSRGEQDGSNP
jgi:hypothetical protein